MQPAGGSTDVRSFLDSAAQNQEELSRATSLLERLLDDVRVKVGLKLLVIAEAELRVDEPPNGILLQDLYNMLSGLRLDDSEVRRRYEALRDGYDRYLKKLRDINHILKLIELEPEYRRRIMIEQRRLTEHLKFFLIDVESISNCWYRTNLPRNSGK